MSARQWRAPTAPRRARRADLLRQHHRAARRRPRRRRGRDRHADRRQRRRQVDADDDDLRQSAGARRHDRLCAARTSPGCRRTRSCAVRIAQSPEGRRIFPRMTVLENLQMGAAITEFAHFDEDLERVFTLFPRLKERQRPARRHAVGRRAADARHRPRADEPAAAAAARRAVARPRAADRQADLRGDPRAEQARGADRLPGRAERLPCPEARRTAAT